MQYYPQDGPVKTEVLVFDGKVTKPEAMKIKGPIAQVTTKIATYPWDAAKALPDRGNLDDTWLGAATASMPHVQVA